MSQMGLRAKATKRESDDGMAMRAQPVENPTVASRVTSQGGTLRAAVAPFELKPSYLFIYIFLHVCKYVDIYTYNICVFI